MRCFIVGLDPGEVARLARLSAALGFPALVRPDLEAVRADPGLRDPGRALVLVAGAALARAAGNLATDLAERAFIVAVTDTIAPEEYKALVRSGAGEWIQWDHCETELADLVKAVAAPAHDDRGARIVSFLPSKGGVGNTALLAEVAVVLAGRRAASRGGAPRVAILDLNFHGGTLADALDVEPRFDLGEIAGRPERLDAQLVEVFTSRYADRLDVFAPPPRARALEEIAPNLIFTFIDAISARYDTILVDLPPITLGWTETLLQGSDAIVVTGIATVPGLRRLRGQLMQLEELDNATKRRLAVINQVGTDLMGRFARRGEIERALGPRESLLVRRDAASLDAAADAGRPLMETAPDSRVGRDIRRLAEWVAAVAARPAQAVHGVRETAA